jgi:hypothetical protein
LAVVAPGGKESIRGGDESLVVRGFDQVDHFVDHYVFQALGRFAGQVGIEADVGGFVIAAAPLGFHALNEEAVDRYFQDGLPLGDECGGFGAQLGVRTSNGNRFG